MNRRVKKICVVGAGSAGYLSALTLKRLSADMEVTIVRSATVPVIGVGESTTANFPSYLHKAIGLDRGQFYREVRPSWKLGIKFLWGAPGVSHFYYPFDCRVDFKRVDLPQIDGYFCLSDPQGSTPYSVLMDQGHSPCFLRQGRYIVDEGFGYHIDNQAFIAFLEAKAEEQGIRCVVGDVVEVDHNDSGTVESLRLSDGREVTGDLFVDCSGFRSLLLGQTIGEPYVSYGDTLFCDTAVIGSYRRDDPILPYTTAETMDHGWCWQIEYDDRVTRGYVHASDFCSPDEAARELKQKNPQIGDDLRTIKFPSGRYENFWVDNVIGIGNASGFVEPLEATALHLISQQLRIVCQTLIESNRRIVPEMRRLQNMRYREMWDDVRDFLALHYKYNHWSDTEFWKHCRDTIDLRTAAPLVDVYREVGPSTQLRKLISSESMFGFSGWMTMLIGQRVTTTFDPELNAGDWRRWNEWRHRTEQEASATLPMRDALEKVYDPSWIWPTCGI
jgi:tryptophan halogenase